MHDRDGAFGEVATTVAGMHIESVRTAPRSPWQNAYIERLIGAIRRECLDHVIVVNEVGLRRVLASYVAYYMPRVRISRWRRTALPRAGAWPAPPLDCHEGVERQSTDAAPGQASASKVETDDDEVGSKDLDGAAMKCDLPVQGEMVSSRHIGMGGNDMAALCGAAVVGEESISTFC